ncbi:hypothetical protein Goklo_025903 [Gossypium klotzschianum]|uniref:F-box associated domain-containing protein n=1 Tax=Gossypium klotzschianum TaxID=34286 RepID=A0A7J8TTC2_9ROSI|nr:hypothetical protein [Gossypium klotzschianum]
MIAIQYLDLGMISPSKFALDLGTEEYYEIKKGDTSFKVKKCESDCSHFEYMNAVLGGCLCVSRDHLTCPVEDHINLWVMKQYGVKESCTELLYLSRDQWLTSIFHTTAVGIEYFLMMAEVVSQLGSIWGMKQGKPCVLQSLPKPDARTTCYVPHLDSESMTETY